MGSQGNTALTLDDFLALCEAAPEGVRYECVGGRAVMMAGATGPHQVASAELVGLLRTARSPGLHVLCAPFDWVLWQVPSLTVRQPDIVVVTAAQAAQDRLMSPPLLAVEILSPPTRATDLGEKRREYARAGAEHYWVVDIARPSVEAFALRGPGRYELAGRAEGDEPLKLSEPFPVDLTPADLLL
jgi:Uma2 family endonuclease